MDNIPPLPSEFGSTWAEFVRDWCLNSELGYSQSDVIRALNALRRLLPQDVARLVTETSRGVGIVAAAVERGRLLADCENARGFASVLERLKTGERSAYSELVVGSSLSRLGYYPSFDAPIDGKNLDVMCEAEQQPVYFEVITPERFDFGIESQKLTKRLGDEIKKSVSGCRIEVELYSIPLEDEIQAVATASRDAAPGEWVAVGTLARIRKTISGQPLPPLFDGDGAQIYIGGDKTLQGASTSSIIRWEESDHRAKRLFNAEYHHFSERVANVLVINVSAVSGGMSEWALTIERLFQPCQNRKVGAVLLFDQGSLGPPEAIRHRWKVLVNPYCHIAVRSTIIEDIKALDESRYYFGTSRS